MTFESGDPSEGAVKAPVRHWLRLEGLAAALAGLWGFWVLGGSWWLLVVLALTPDLSFLAYLAGSRIGAVVYNLAHSYVAPAVLAAIGIGVAMPQLTHIALIWIIHIGVDRTLGYGLKYPDAFTSTHLGKIGRASS